MLKPQLMLLGSKVENWKDQSLLWGDLAFISWQVQIIHILWMAVMAQIETYPFLHPSRNGSELNFTHIITDSSNSGPDFGRLIPSPQY